uniref:Gibberellin regulated protein n=1 Tax=Oryza punctata TaxID=4537 RepID=A0A0E0KG25_ORYPU
MKTRRAALLTLLLLVVAAAQPCLAASGFCASKCAVRCGRGQGRARVSACLRSCGLCCEECNCVPTGTGTGGSRDECPCYRDMLTAGPRKRPKCP